MPKTHRGGQSRSATRIAAAALTSQQAQQNTPPPPVQPPPVQGGAVSFSDFQKMTPDEKASAMAKALSEPTPLNLDDNDLQRFAYSLGLDNRPQVVSDAQLDKMSGIELYRTVNSGYDPSLDIGYRSKEIIDQIRYGNTTRFSDDGHSVYGNGLYFATSYTGSRMYGNQSRSPSMARAKIAPNARIISDSTAASKVAAEIRSGSRLGRVLQGASSKARNGLWCLANGYQGTQNGAGYYMIYDRSALVMSDKTINPFKQSRW